MSCFPIFFPFLALGEPMPRFEPETSYGSAAGPFRDGWNNDSQPNYIPNTYTRGEPAGPCNGLPSDGCQVSTTFDFSEALRRLKEDEIVARRGWNGKGMFVGLHYPLPFESCTLPFLWMFTADEETVPWLASQTDLLADDWMEV